MVEELLKVRELEFSSFHSAVVFFNLKRSYTIKIRWVWGNDFIDAWEKVSVLSMDLDNVPCKVLMNGFECVFVFKGE